MEVASSNAALMRRIVQLEKEIGELQRCQCKFSGFLPLKDEGELLCLWCKNSPINFSQRDELQKDIETMCLQQSGVAGSIDINTRMQARRAAGLEQELEASKEKAVLLSRENHNLQEELSEAYRLKNRLTEAFKAAVEKNNQVEKEVKFYQTQVAAALAERDKAVVEVDRVHEIERTMTAEVHDLLDRLEDVGKQYKDREAEKIETQQYLETLKSQFDLLHKVLEKFWGLRQIVLGVLNKDGQSEDLGVLDKATTLITESDSKWRYGGIDQEAVESLQQELKDIGVRAEEYHLLARKEQLRAEELEAQLVGLKQEVEATTISLQMKLEEEQYAREQAEGDASTYKVQLEELENSTSSQLQKLLQVQNDHEDLRSKVDNLLEDERQWIATMVVNAEAIIEELKARGSQSELVDKYEELRGPPEREEISGPQNSSSALSEAEETTTSESVAFNEEVNVSEHLESEDAFHTPPIALVVSTLPEFEQEIIITTAEAVSAADTNEGQIVQEEHFLVVTSMGKSATIMDNESQSVLAQALHEKVEALLLLSQQEERYYLESKTIQGLENQIKDLNQKISQVTNEKVTALMEVAQLRQDCQRLEEREKELIRRLQLHRSTNAGGRLLPASWSDSSIASQTPQEMPPAAAENKRLVVPKPSLMTTSGYFRSWLRGMEASGGALGLDTTKRSVGIDASRSIEKDAPVDFAKLRVENAALQERVASVQRLTNSAHGLRMLLVKASNISRSQEAKPLQAALDALNGVTMEANRLRIALGFSLPVSSPPPIEEILPASDVGIISSSESEASSAPIDVSTAAGMEMVELLLIASELQKAVLLQQLELLSIDKDKEL